MTSFRHNRLCKRRGPLWQNKFKSVIVESPAGLSLTLKYVELNPVRAKVVKDPALYKWSSWGEMRGGKFHPYRQRITESLRWCYSLSENWSDARIFADYGRELMRLALIEYEEISELEEYFPDLIYNYLLGQNAKLTRRDRLVITYEEDSKT